MSRGKLPKKQILHLSKPVLLKISENYNLDQIIKELKQLGLDKKIIFGVNSIHKHIIKNDIQMIIFSKNDDFIESMQPLLNISTLQKIPIFSLSISSKELAQYFGLKSCSSIGIIKNCNISSYIKNNSIILPQNTGLPYLSVDIDIFNKK